MDFERFSESDLFQSLEAECAKSLGEIRCARGDLDKVESRLRFILSVIHSIKDRKVKRYEVNTTSSKTPTNTNRT
jgi:hypothetical protein